MLALVIIAPLGTLVFWWLGTVPDHYIPALGREVFGNVPEPVLYDEAPAAAS